MNGKEVTDEIFVGYPISRFDESMVKMQDPVEQKYMVLLAKETNLREANKLAVTLRNIRRSNEILKVSK